jgi:hypothetical protein
MTNQFVAAAALIGGNTAPPHSVSPDKFDTLPNLPGLDTPKREKPEKTTFHKFKIKISFTVPRNDEIKPRDKFATLLSIFQQQHKDTTLEQWDVEEINQAQSIIAGADLPHECGKLSVYCPHIRRNTRLETQWRIKSTARYYEFKTNPVILDHLQRHKIYMNPTEITQIEATVAGFFVFSHIKYHSRKDAIAELKTRAALSEVDLHVHTCRHMQRRHTKAIAISCGKSVVREVKSKLYQMNNQHTGDKSRYPHTQHWIFVPFKADGTITEQHIAMMIRKQNAYLRDETAISVTGLRDIDTLVFVPGTTTEISFHRWMLTVKTADKTKYLFSAIEKDPNEVYCFVTRKALRGEAEMWIDNLPEILATRFSEYDTNNVTTDSHPTRSYRVIPSEHTNDAVLAYNSILADVMTVDESLGGTAPDEVAIVEEDVLENCWKAPTRSIYSHSGTDATLSSTVSGITDVNSPQKSVHADNDAEVWNELVKRTELLEKAAEDLAETEKVNQEELERKNTEWEEKQTQMLCDMQEKNEAFTRDMITENFDKLLHESEEAKKKSKKMEEWRIAFDAEQKKRFRDQEKKISKKIDAKISDLSSAMDAKLQAHQDQSLQMQKKNETYMTDNFAKIFSFMSNLKTVQDTHAGTLGSIQDYTQKENGKRQRHGADTTDLDSDMEDSDTLREINRDALAPDTQEGRGGF